jgi:muramoyltetrapeptide carboxypeptidase
VSTAPRRPPAIGDSPRIVIVAPSGPIDQRRFASGFARARHELGDAVWTESENLHDREGYFAGDDAARTGAIQAALRDPESQVIWCARGGYGSTRILGGLDGSLLRRQPKCIIGFSDVTALLCWAWVKGGLSSLHGPVITQLAGLHPMDVSATVEWLRGEVPPPLEADADAVSVIGGGSVDGPLFPANLEVLRSLVGTPWLPDFRGGIVALEEVGEQPYRIDRALTQLISSGAFTGVVGVVVGQLTACDDPRADATRPTASAVVEERLRRLGVPVFTGAPFGHAADRNAPLPFGARVRMNADDATLHFLEPVTAPA